MSRSRARRSFVAALTAVALSASWQLGAPVAQAAAATPPTTMTQHQGRWTVVSDENGTTISWDGTATLPTGDARPEFALGGVRLGVPLGGVHGEPLRLKLPGLQGVQIAALSVELAGRRVDVVQSNRTAVPTRPSTLPTQPPTMLTPDPGARGPYATTAFSYHLGDLTIDGVSIPVEVLGQVIAPVGAPGKRPVVLFLHGRHATCYLGAEVTIDWPCAPGYKAIPSLQGYRYIQNLLASRGYVTVSIAANGINGQDGGLLDSGAHARSVLVRHHLSLLAAWNGTAAGPTGASSLRGHLDLQHVMLVGHSRGGEGVARAAIDATTPDPYRIAGQVLIAPTDFGREVASGVPTTVLLPYCDGDVSDLQGQQYVDQSRGLATGDHSLVTSAMVFGADHNFFNSEWTPAVAKAPAQDDWYDDSDPVCGASATGRLTSAAQRSVGATYVSAAADSYLSASTSAVKLLDGSKIRAASAGAAVVFTEALGGARTPLIGDPAGIAPSSTPGMTAGLCLGFTEDGSAQCVAEGNGTSPNWLRGELPSTYALRAGWTSTTGTANVRFPASLNVSGSTYLDVRVIADPLHASSGFSFILIDSAGHSAVVAAGSVEPLPGTANTRKLWATTVRVPIASFKNVDLTKVVAFGLRGTTPTGLVYLLDAFAANSGQVPSAVSPRSLPRFNVTSSSVLLPPDDAVHNVRVTVAISGTVKVPARLWVLSQDGGKSGNARTLVTIAPGTRSFFVTVPALSSSLFSTYPDQILVAVYAEHDAVVANYIGKVEVLSNVPAPTLRALQPQVEVTQGGTIRWTLRLSAPTRYGWYGSASATKPASGTELTTADLLRAWVVDHTSSPTLPNGDPAPLSESGAAGSINFDGLNTTYTLEIPTAAISASKVDRVVEFDIDPDGVIVTAPLKLTAVIHPKP